MTKYEKLFISLRYWLHGRNYMKAAEALHFAACYHQGLRKDGATPEFEHQLTITHYLRTLENNLMFPELSSMLIQNQLNTKHHFRSILLGLNLLKRIRFHLAFVSWKKQMDLHLQRSKNLHGSIGSLDSKKQKVHQKHHPPKHD